MKRIGLLMVLGATMIFSACQKDSPEELVQGDQLTPVLKATQVYFEGLCQNGTILYCGDIQELPNGMVKVMNFESEWEDNTNDPLTTGRTHWVEHFLISKDQKSAKVWGKATLTVEGGEWAFSMQGNMKAKGNALLIAPCAGMPAPCEIYARVQAVGKSGVVKGMVGEWIYTMDFDGFAAGDAFEYEITGWYQYAP